ncbi:hypothetical protein [Methanococcoides alaskense]|uniref:Uncharacterized protein n=1 Tax=Methanococcoides alaskense TaxID=325778 RepID=A0AA90TXA3_9EURY|nr:hypothetical protein [Methanococcoides alaskense]MDA0525356.1 hypothetical protein [Methanococcoides alaskense]MDR6221714.1 hypothetical protein [Methanococcoides alaskense]
MTEIEVLKNRGDEGGMTSPLPIRTTTTTAFVFSDRTTGVVNDTWFLIYNNKLMAY